MSYPAFRSEIVPGRLNRISNALVPASLARKIEADLIDNVVGEDVQRHFGADVLECLHLEVRRSRPGLYCTEGMLDRLTTQTHLVRVPIKPRLHGLKDGKA